MNRTLTAAAFAMAALAAPASALDLSAMTDAEKAAFRAEIRAYLLDNPEVIMEAVAVLEQRQQAQKAADEVNLVRVNADAIFNDGYSWVGGNPDGDITLVEFMDYRCGYCRKAFDEVNQLLESDGNIRFIVKEFPILGEESVLASRFAIATKIVAGDDAYEKVHNALMTYRGKVAEGALRRIAKDADIDADAVLAKLESPEVNDVIARNHQLAGRLSITGTPTFVLGEEMLRGYVPLDGMQQIVEEVRAN